MPFSARGNIDLIDSSLPKSFVKIIDDEYSNNSAYNARREEAVPTQYQISATHLNGTQTNSTLKSRNDLRKENETGQVLNIKFEDTPKMEIGSIYV